MNQEGMFYCTSCSNQTRFPKMKGSGWIELILWLCYIIPGLIYSIWRRSSAPSVCPTCHKETLIPTALANPGSESCPRCKENIKGNALVCHFCNFELPFLDATVRGHVLQIKSLVANGLSNDQVADQLNSQGINCLANKGLWNADLIGNIRSDFAL